MHADPGPGMATPRTIAVTVDKSHLITIGEKLYAESIELIRELVNNAYDADATVAGAAGRRTADPPGGLDYARSPFLRTVGALSASINPSSPTNRASVSSNERRYARLTSLATT